MILWGVSYGKVIRVPLEYDTIQAGIDVAESGDVVKVDAGAYDEQVTMKEGVNVIGSGAEYTSIIHAEYSVYVVIGASNCTLKGFTIDSRNKGGGITCTDVSSMNVSCNEIINHLSYGILTNNSSININNNRINLCSRGVQCDNTPELCKINNNIITDISGDGINCHLNYTINNNVICKCKRGVFFSSLTFYNNIIIDCEDGLHSSGDDHNHILSFYNNLFKNKYNFMYFNTYSQSFPYNNTYVDPLFVDPNNGDYHLQANSPCRDTGAPEISFNDPDGTRNDMGAYGGPGAIDWEPFTSGMPVVTKIVVSPNPVAKDGTITIKATGKIQP